MQRYGVTVIQVVNNIYHVLMSTSLLYTARKKKEIKIGFTLSSGPFHEKFTFILFTQFPGAYEYHTYDFLILSVIQPIVFKAISTTHIRAVRITYTGCFLHTRNFIWLYCIRQLCLATKHLHIQDFI